MYVTIIMPPTPPPRPPRKVRSNKGIKRKPNVVLNNKGVEVLNMISQAPIPREYAITVQKQEYDARELLRWFEVSKTLIVPHTRDELRSVDFNLVKYRAYGSRKIFARLKNQLKWELRPSQIKRKSGWVFIRESLSDTLRVIHLYNYLFFQDYTNSTTYGNKVTLHPLPKGLYSKKDDIEFYKSFLRSINVTKDFLQLYAPLRRNAEDRVIFPNHMI